MSPVEVTGSAYLSSGANAGSVAAQASVRASVSTNTQTLTGGTEHAEAYEGARAQLDMEGYRHDGAQGSVKASVNWVAEHFRGGNLIWSDKFSNLVVTAGLNKLLDATFKTGLASPAWYVGLVDGATPPVYAAADTMASHAGWVELTAYDEAARQAFTAGTIAAGSVDNSASRAVFTFSGTGTVIGFFLNSVATKGGTLGTLYSVGAFVDLPDGRAVVDDDIMRITATISISVE